MLIDYVKICYINRLFSKMSDHRTHVRFIKYPNTPKKCVVRHKGVLKI